MQPTNIINVWHIEVHPGWPNSPTRLYCNIPTKDVAPFFLGIEAIVTHQGRITVCSSCWSKATSGILFDTPIPQNNDTSPQLPDPPPYPSLS